MFAAVLDAQFAQLFGFSDLRGMGIAKYRASLLKQFDYSAYAVPLWRTQIVPPFKELIRDDEKRKAEERLEMLGLDSEESELTKQDFEDIRKEALAQLKRREKKDWRCRRSISGPVLARPDRARVPRRAWRR